MTKESRKRRSRTAALSLLDLVLSNDPALRPDKPDYYLDFYHEMFDSIREDSLNILEVGVQRGGSTLLWAKYFPRSRVLGVDINPPPPEFDDAVRRENFSDRIRVAIVSQDDDPGLRGEIDSYFGGEKLDLVIDDASHYYPETRSTFETVFSRHLKAGGTYVIEDWGCGYWPLWHDGNRDGRHGLPRLVKELVDLLALPDRTKFWGDQRTLPVDSELQSPISRIVLLNSIAVLVRSGAEMVNPELWSSNDEHDTNCAVGHPTGRTEDRALGLRALLRQLPSAGSRTAARIWKRLWQRPDSTRPPASATEP